MLKSLTKHEDLMKEAIKLAILAKDKGETPVGAILVLNGDIIGRGIQDVENKGFVGAHAEILALENASKNLKNWRLSGSSLYTTLEPCPMCMSAIILSRVDKVFFGAFDKRLGAAGSIFNLAELPSLPHNPSVVGGILEEDCSLLLTDFFKQIRKN